MYTNYYGFSAKPFQLSPDPRFFFGSSVHKRALAYLRYGLSQAEGFIVITGGIGTGKTTLVRNLFNELDTKSVVAAQLVTTQLEAEDLLRMVVAAFGLPHDGLNKAALIKRFEDFLTVVPASTRTRVRWQTRIVSGITVPPERGPVMTFPPGGGRSIGRP
jgi:type II secretory pathway predicted ATPase ExeA